MITIAMTAKEIHAYNRGIPKEANEHGNKV
jgi:hypothetical protein